MLLSVLIVLVTLGGGVGTAQALPAPPAPVPHLDITRYAGLWHQLAAVPQPFNLACARDTRARYSLDARGEVVVQNSCTTWQGATNAITGRATVVDQRTGAQLHVSFPGVPTQENRFGPPNYVVVALGPDYSWALVTDPYRVSGFVLSRKPSLSADQWRSVRTEIAKAGENACWYLTSPVTGGIGEIRPLCSR
ncbi:lipocalin family protein [Gordonia sp. (in: high G+C Gram-positive bacteria)]|uniref:lipocalin family protein n=1 Tax=Gordonia TaxID=2053 RepID=UPI003C7765D2